MNQEQGSAAPDAVRLRAEIVSAVSYAMEALPLDAENVGRLDAIVTRAAEIILVALLERLADKHLHTVMHDAGLAFQKRAEELRAEWREATPTPVTEPTDAALREPRWLKNAKRAEHEEAQAFHVVLEVRRRLRGEAARCMKLSKGEADAWAQAGDEIMAVSARLDAHMETFRRVLSHDTPTQEPAALDSYVRALVEENAALREALRQSLGVIASWVNPYEPEVGRVMQLGRDALRSPSQEKRAPVTGQEAVEHEQAILDGLDIAEDEDDF